MLQRVILEQLEHIKAADGDLKPLDIEHHRYRNKFSVFWGKSPAAQSNKRKATATKMKRSKLEKMKAFGRSARDNNISQVSENKKPKEKRPSCREKAIEFASKIPKPKRKVQKENCADHKETPMHPVSELEKMEAKHQMDKKHVEVHKPLLFGVLI
ncbi:hypothetical protein L7F22_034835 [Adiantum nelumboides]|nr:hypothetical protein [Adiantum nelumboides]